MTAFASIHDPSRDIGISQSPPPTYFRNQTLGPVLAACGILAQTLAGALMCIAAFARINQPDLIQDSLGFDTIEFRLFVSAVELLLGVWIMFDHTTRLARRCAIVVYFFFASFNVVQAMQGQSTCGCFGRLVTFHPWTMTVVDATIGLSLLTLPSRTGTKWSAWGSACIAAVAFVTIGFFGLTVTGQARYIAARLMNIPVIVEPQVVHVLPGQRGEVREFVIDVANVTPRDLRLIGGTSDCSCFATAGMPVKIPSGATVQVSVQIHLRGTEGPFLQRFHIITDAPEAGPIEAFVRGQIIIDQQPRLNEKPR